MHDEPARVLIIAPDAGARLELESSLPVDLHVRSVGAASETEGLGTDVVVIGGEFPLAELTEVRVHPQLHNKPVVLFAPGRDLPVMDWRSISVWPVTERGQANELAGHVSRLLATD